MTPKDLTEDLLRRALASAEKDAELAIGRQFFNCSFLLESGATQFVVRVHEGRFQLIATPFVEEWDFALRAAPEAWDGFLASPPPAGYHDIWAAAWAGRMKIEGNLTVFMAHHLSVWRVLKLVREAASGPVSAPTPSGMGNRPRAASKPVGRYVDVEVEGHKLEVFYLESTGPGTIPLLCQHTAGAHNHQFRSLLRDADVTSKYRVIAYDLPYHGKSDPPIGEEWWKEEYKLTTSFFEKFVVSFSRALELDRPVYLGCSMGGVLGLHLALKEAKEFRAIIAMEAGEWTPGFYTKWWAHPAVDGRELVASVADGLIAPHTSEADRRLTMWYYAQGGPGVVKGDLYFYSMMHDLRRNEENRPSVCDIDCTKTPLYMLTGRYDYLTTPDASEATAKQIPHAQFQVLEKLGHFPMSESHELLMKTLGPILNNIAER
jgi:pimeloyl-ACP methyl ester carboxylesterase